MFWSVDLHQLNELTLTQLKYGIAGIYRRTTIYFITENFRRRKFSNSFIQAKSKLAIVCTRDAQGDPCQVVQYYGYGHTP